MEDPGWVAHFAISALFGKPITIYGNGKQVRDVLFVDDLVDAFEAFVKRSSQLREAVFNLGGGPSLTLSLLEFLTILEGNLRHQIPAAFSEWRPADQKVYISDIRKAGTELSWGPKMSPAEGVRRLVSWISAQVPA